MNILVIGPSGAGKTYVVSKLEHGIDLDQMLLKTSGYSSIQDWVKLKGWDNFRKAEDLLLRQLLQADQQIIALGAGAINENNFMTLNFQNAEIYLLCEDFETCWERIKDDLNGRPLVEKGYDFNFDRYRQKMEFFRKLPLKSEFKNTEKLIQYLKSV